MGREFTNYSQHSGTQAKQSEKALKMLAEAVKKELKSGESVHAVLDAGCGDGEVTEQLDRVLRNEAGIKELKILGLDKTNKRLSEARKNHSTRDISYVRGDLKTPPVNYQFDAIFSNAALHWISEQDEMYRNFNKILRKDGILTVHQGAAGSYIELHNIAVKTAQAMGINIQERKMPPAYLSPDEATGLLENHDFNVVEMDAVEYPIQEEEIVHDFAEASLSSYFDEISGEKKIMKFKERFIENGTTYMKEGGQVAARRLYFTALNS